MLRRLALILLPLIWLCPVSQAAAEPALKTGVSYGLLSWGNVDKTHDSYAWPVYGLDHAVDFDLLRRVSAYGFDFIRLTVDPGPMMAFKGERQEALERQLLETVRTIERAGLDVIVDFHPIHRVKAYSPEAIESEGVGGLFSAYAEMVGRTARLLSRLDPRHIALEPMNEPQLGYSQVSRERWQGMMERLYDAARAQAPELAIIITGCEGGGLDGLEYLDPGHFKGGHVRYSFHYYAPYAFTHQGVQDNPDPGNIWPYATGIPYPATRADEKIALVAAEKRIDGAPGLASARKTLLRREARKWLDRYFEQEGSHAYMMAQFARATAWAQKNGIDPHRLFLGEFDATQKTSFSDGAYPHDRLRWLADARSEAEKRGFGWCLWGLKGKTGAGMLLVSPEDQTRIDLPTAKALGKSMYTP